MTCGGQGEGEWWQHDAVTLLPRKNCPQRRNMKVVCEFISCAMRKTCASHPLRPQGMHCKNYSKCKKFEVGTFRKWLIWYWNWGAFFCRQRPYHVENTGSRLITAVKQRWAWLVLGWVTAWEHHVLLALFCVCVSVLPYFLSFLFWNFYHWLLDFLSE